MLKDTVVIGAGIVGLAAAMQLRLRGVDVTVIDPNKPASGCSSGNAGYLSHANIFPPTSTESLFKIPKMLASPDGPLVIRPSHMPAFLPWAVAAAYHTRPKRLARIVEATVPLIMAGIESYAPLLKAAGAERMVVRNGGLIVARTEAGLRARSKRVKALQDHGVRVDVVSAGEVYELEPGLAPGLVGGIFYRDSAHCINPRGLGETFAAYLAANGCDFIEQSVREIAPAPDGGWTVRLQGTDIAARRVVVCAGRWSDALMRPLGHRVPLASERGYHLMLPSPNVALSRVVSMAEAFFVATPMEEGLRLAGTAEFAALTAPMNPRRATMMLDLARPFFPSLSGEGAKPWMGTRPSFPDGLPAIGGSKRHQNLFYCFGHNHNGLMQAAISGRMIADLMLEGTEPISLAPYSLDRFKLF